jgi:hypothetical protein
MQMMTYLVYDTNTGEVIHMHSEPVGLGTSRDEVIQIAGVGEHRHVDVLEVPGSELPSHPVRVEGGQLQRVDADGPSGGAAVVDVYAEPSSPREYRHIRPTQI